MSDLEFVIFTGVPLAVLLYALAVLTFGFVRKQGQNLRYGASRHRARGWPVWFRLWHWRKK